jgi:hypothetical protein
VIARAGDRAAWRFVEFFTVNIRNRNTRVAYSRAAAVFLDWCEARDLSLAGVRVATDTQKTVTAHPPTMALETL